MYTFDHVDNLEEKFVKSCKEQEVRFRTIKYIIHKNTTMKLCRFTTVHKWVSMIMIKCDYLGLFFQEPKKIFSKTLRDSLK